MIKKILYGIALLLFVVLLYHAYDLYTFKKERNSTMQEKGLQTMSVLKNEVNGLQSEIVLEAERLAADLGKNDYSQAEIEEIIKKSALSKSALHGITACYEPYAQSDDQRLYCPFYNKNRDDYIFIGKRYDYADSTKSGKVWYTNPRDQGAQWMEPYFGGKSVQWLVEYSIPFYHASGPKEGKVKGIVIMNFRTKWFKNLIQSLSLGKTGYGMLTSKEGNFLSHPTSSYTGIANLREIIAEERKEPLIGAYENMLAGKSGNASFELEGNSGEALVFYDKIPASGWGVAVMFNKNELLRDTNSLHHRYIKFALLFSGLLLILIALYFNKDHLDRQEIWQLSFLATILLIMNVSLISYLQHMGNRAVEEESLPIADMASIENFVDEQNMRYDVLKLTKPTPVPTGIYINRMAFVNSYNLNVSGTIWQKYPVEIADKVTVGFRLPQTSPFAEASSIEESHRTIIKNNDNSEGYLLIAWNFRVTLQQYLDYRNFPFDKRHISVDIVPKNKDEGLLFIPDLASYEFTGPTRKPGLDPLVKIPGDRIMKGYFSYILESYDADFGLESDVVLEDVPMLQYNIDLRRILLSVFVTYLIPIFVVLVMMFILIQTCLKTEERQGIIEAMAAFFFVLIFSHIDMRKEIITADLIFMEYFYFITYFFILLSTWNLISYAKNQTPIFDYGENLVFKALYFPFFFLCVLLVTLVKFY